MTHELGDTRTLTLTLAFVRYPLVGLDQLCSASLCPRNVTTRRQYQGALSVKVH
eukprot:m.324999 g.324999  ORF g.324999 m.324999 type:complete len:54 (-) comp27639_c1_seq6:2446-2607(-)